MEHIMIKGRRARTGSGSPNSDRPVRWGAPIIGVCQRTLCACCIGCRVDEPCTDRSSSEHWLERSSHPSLGSECGNHFESHVAAHQISSLLPIMISGP